MVRVSNKETLRIDTDLQFETIEIRGSIDEAIPVREAVSNLDRTSEVCETEMNPTLVTDSMLATSNVPRPSLPIAYETAPTVPKSSVQLRLESQLRHSNRQLEQLSIAAKVFSLQLDYDTLLAEIAGQGVEICRAEQAVVYVLKENQLQHAASFPHRPSEVIASEKPSQDAILSARYLRPYLASLGAKQEGVRTSMCIPLVGTQNRVLGVLELRDKKIGGLFNEGDLRAANALARIATTAVDRALLFERAEEWTKSMETLLSFNATINRHLEPDQLVRQLVANVTGFLDADGGAAGILFQVETDPYLECNSIFHDGKWHDYQRVWRSKEGIPGMILETEFPYLVSDYQHHPLSDPDLIARFAIGCCICVPIKNAQEQVLGFFKLHRNIGKPEFTWQDAAFLESLGNTAAVAIENARLVQSLDRKNQQVKSLSEAHVRRLEDERRHISRELHDEAGQVLIGLKLRLQIVSGMLHDEQKDVREELDNLRYQVNEATAKLKDLAKRLRPPTLDELGFEATIRQLVAEYRKQVDFEIALEFSKTPPMTSDVQTALYRIAQESLTNIVKHANATHVTIRLMPTEDAVEFTVQDDGIGFDDERPTNGLGLIGICERVKMLGGSIAISSRPGTGTTIQVRIENDSK